MDMQIIWPRVRRLENAAESGGMGRIVRKRVTEGNLVDISEENLIGVKATTHVQGRRKLVLPTERPSFSADSSFWTVLRIEDNLQISAGYMTRDGALDKPCFIFSGELLPYSCGLFSGNKEPYDSLLYAYEETHDNLGAGITFQQGWYAVNSQTFANEAININDYPVYILDEDCRFLGSSHELIAFGESCFPFAEAETRVITHDNLFEVSGHTIVFSVCGPLADSFVTDPWFAKMFVVTKVDNFNVVTSEYATLSWNEIHPIDPKYIPALDSITLNSPGGKRFTVTVDDTGAITAAET